jgi:mono/diheme cytochrome c family protein
MDEPISMTGCYPAKYYCYRPEGGRDSTSGARRLLIAVCLVLAGAGSLAYAQPEQGATRGELLYSAHCSTCHAAEIHWRAQTLATDWRSLKAQVRRWQDNIGLSWSEDEITDVTRYLNTAYYHFPAVDKKDLTQDGKPQPVATP